MNGKYFEARIFPDVWSKAFITSKKQHDYEMLIRLIPGKVKGEIGKDEG